MNQEADTPQGPAVRVEMTLQSKKQEVFMAQNHEELEREADALFVQMMQRGDEAPEDAKSEDTAEDAAETETAPEDSSQDAEDTAAHGNGGSNMDDGAEEEFVSMERYKNAERRMHQATQEAAELRREIEALKQRLASLQQQQQQPDATDDGDDEKREFSNDRLRQAMEEFPEVVEPLVDEIKRLNQELSDVKRYISSAQERDARTAQEAHIAAIRQAHPDLDEIVASSKFKQWLASQPPKFQEIAQAGTAQDVILLLDLFKRSFPDEYGLQNSALEKARKKAVPNVRPNTSRQPDKPKLTREQIAKMSMEEFVKHEAEIDKLLQAGAL